MNLKHVKTFEHFYCFGPDCQVPFYEVICDESCADIVRDRYKHAQSCSTNSSIISSVRSIISENPKKEITIYIDDRKYNDKQYDERVSFISEFIGKGNYSIKKVSNI